MQENNLFILKAIADWLVYILCPENYDNQEFLTWNKIELSSITNFYAKTVLDIGSGTGKLAFIGAEQAKSVFCIEPVGNLRDYIKNKAKLRGIKNIYVVDGLITSIPFPDEFSDITMAGHVFGDEPDIEYEELMRVTKLNGKVILCPGNVDKDNDIHKYLVNKGFKWARFEEPGDGIKRKYWKNKEFA